MARQFVVPATVHTANNYTHAVKVDRTVYVSGQVALDRDSHLVGRGDVEVQAGQAFENMRAVLEAAGARMEDVVKLTIYATHYSFRPKIVEARSRYFSRVPASTFVVVTSLADPDLLVEIEAVAVIDPQA